jgi:ribosomal protein S18 acetylase RimI-like enzyme
MHAEGVYTVEMAEGSFVKANPEALVFRPLELPGDGPLAVQFSEDAFVCSFGNAERFWAEAGRDGRRWVDRLGEKLLQDPRNAVNAWLRGTLVGQVVLGSSDTEPNVGHVNLYYLVPQWRGRGFASQLDGYAVAVLRDQGYRIATLNVSPTNMRAIRFYLRYGWYELGPRPDAPFVHAMARVL